MKQKVAIGLSGGVDSAVSAALLVEQGYEVSGVYLTCWDGPGCRSEEDRQDALTMALALKIPFVHLDYQKEYKEKVYEYIVAEYQAGRTPNPDVMCNREIKFGLFYEWVMKQGFAYVATGHYAQTDGTHLLKSKDEHKDQTYFLYQLKEEQLGHILFPIGHLTKQEVRDKAIGRALPVANKPDSQGICFIGEVNVSKFLEERIEKQLGEIKLGETVVGKHKGVWFYTIGQKVTGLDSKPLQQLGFDTTHLPHFYVKGKEMETNTLTIGVREQLYTSTIYIGDWHWIGEKPRSLTDSFIRVRHGGKLVKISNWDEKEDTLILAESVWGVAPGQVGVIYEGNACLGGGVIR